MSSAAATLANAVPSEARAAELQQAWAFKCRRFNVAIDVADLGEGYPLPCWGCDSEGRWWVAVNAWLSPEAQERQIAEFFETIAREYGTPEQAAATHAERGAQLRELLDWEWGHIPTMPEWLREGLLNPAAKERPSNGGAHHG